MRTINPALALLVTGAVLWAAALLLRAIFDLGPSDGPVEDDDYARSDDWWC